MSEALTGTYTAQCGILALPVDDVRKMLMPGAELAPQTITPPGQHPIMVMLGEETNVRFPWLPFIPAVSYGEVTVPVPWVFCVDSPGVEMAHTARLWLNNLLATIGGRVLGFPKIWARIATGASDYQVRSLLAGTQIVSAQWRLQGEAKPPAAFPKFAPLVPIFEQHFLQRLFCMMPIIGMVMMWDVSAATMQPEALTLEVFEGAERGIPPGVYRIPSIEESVLGAFRLTVNWQLGWPSLMR